METKPPKLFQYLFPTIANILWIITFFRVLYIGHNMMNADGDLAMHLTIGRFILDRGYIPLTDHFSHTMAGQSVTQHEWLTTVLMAFLQRLFDFEGVILYCAIVIAAAFGVVYRRVYKETQNYLIIAFVVFFATVTSMVHWLARPHVITFLFLAIWMLQLHQMHKGHYKYWWILPATMLLWVNMHGGFIAGIFTWAIYGIGVGWDVLWKRYPEGEGLPKRFLKYYLLSGATSLGVTLINPSGFGLWVKVITHVGNKYLADNTLEFRSPNFHWVSVWPFLIYIALLIVVLAFSKKRVSSPLLFCSVAWLAMSLYGGRNVPLFAIVAAPLLAQELDTLFNNLSTRYKFVKRIQNLNFRLNGIDQHLKGVFWPIFCVVIVVTGLLFGTDLFPKERDYSFDPEVFPVEAVNWLEENPQEGEMFNYFTWGGYLQYRLWPDKKVFIDGKSDFYGEDFVRQYQQIISVQEDWADILGQYKVEWAILPTDEVLVKMLKADQGWEEIYKDDTAIILRSNN